MNKIDITQVGIISAIILILSGTILLMGCTSNDDFNPDDYIQVGFHNYKVYTLEVEYTIDNEHDGDFSINGDYDYFLDKEHLKLRKGEPHSFVISYNFLNSEHKTFGHFDNITNDVMFHIDGISEKITYVENTG